MNVFKKGRGEVLDQDENGNIVRKPYKPGQEQYNQDDMPKQSLAAFSKLNADERPSKNLENSSEDIYAVKNTIPNNSMITDGTPMSFAPNDS